MSSNAKVRAIGARKAPELLTISALVTFAERVIRTDKDAALRAQNSADDLNAPSNDSRPQPRISALNELCAKSGSVKVKLEEQDDEDAGKLISLTRQRRGS